MKLVCGCEITKDERRADEWGIAVTCSFHGGISHKARIKRLEEALRPFACVCQNGCVQRNYDNCINRRAREALK